MKKLNFLVVVLLASCSSWDKRLVAQNKEGNFFVKKQSSNCQRWLEAFEALSKKAAQLRQDSNAKTTKCILSGRDNSDTQIEPYKNKLLSELEEFVKSTDFKRHTFDSCFGAPAYSFLHDLLISSYNSYSACKLYCSIEVYKLFQKSKSPNDFKDSFKELFMEDVTRMSKIDEVLSDD